MYTHYIVLMLSIKGGNKKNTKKSDGSPSVGSLSLTRPLICVCNDHYAPSLRELRKVFK